MSDHPANDEDPICYSCESAVLLQDLKEFDYQCPHCDAKLSAEIVHQGYQKIAEIRLNSSTSQRDIDIIKSRFDQDHFLIDTNGPEPPEGSQQTSITVYRLYIPPSE